MDYTDEALNQKQGSALDEKKERKNRFKFKKEAPGQAEGAEKGFFKKIFTKKVIILIALAVVVLAGAIVGISYAGNNYMTPVHYAEKQANQKRVDAKKAFRKNLNRLGVKNTGEIAKIMLQSDSFMDRMERIEDRVEEEYEAKQNAYGDNFKIKYTVEDKIPLERSDLRDYRNDFRDTIGALLDAFAGTDDFSSSEWGDLADALELSRTQAKKLTAAYRETLESFDRLEVTKGYELDVLVTVTGDMLEEPVERSLTIDVLKVNGRWITASDWEAINFLSQYSSVYPSVAQIPVIEGAAKDKTQDDADASGYISEYPAAEEPMAGTEEPMPMPEEPDVEAPAKR